MDAMPRPRPPHLVRETTRHSRVVWYVRRSKGARIRIRAAYGTPEFTAAYEAAIKGETAPDPAKFNAKTLGWLVDRYRESAAWAKLSTATRRQRECILRLLTKAAGREPISRIDKATINKGVERRMDRPHSARHFLQTMRGLFQWAVTAKLADHDPTAGIKTIRPQTDGHVPWTDEWCDWFEARWPLGTRERVAYAVLMYTGLRRGDAVRVGRPHIKKGIITIRTEKRSGGKPGKVVTIPILPPLQEALDAGPIGDLTFIAGVNGRPLKKESFGNWFRDVCEAAGVPSRAHGMRKAGATRAANNGATEAQLEAIFAWSGGAMASLYTREANRVKLAADAASKLMTERDVNLYSRTSNPVRDTEKKIS
jgi:integrase